jgi:hypothetical protein
VLFGLLLAATTALAEAPTPTKKDEVYRLKFKVTVDVNGMIKDCVITEPSGNAEFDGTTCDRLKVKARFKPKLDDKGKPVEFEFERYITYIIKINFIIISSLRI